MLNQRTIVDAQSTHAHDGLVYMLTCYDVWSGTPPGECSLAAAPTENGESGDEEYR